MTSSSNSLPAYSQAYPVGPGSYNMAPTDAQPPQKWVVVNSVPTINPNWLEWKKTQDSTFKTSVPFPSEALPVVSSMEDFAALSQAAAQGGLQPFGFTTQTTTMIEQVQDSRMCKRIGVSPDEMVDKLGVLLTRKEIPMGLFNRVMMLSTFDEIEFNMDDSGSMNNLSDTVDAYGRPQTRWEEGCSRLKEMLEILAYIKCPVVKIGFLNRKDVIEIKQSHCHSPEEFIEKSFSKIDKVFARIPTKYDLTPTKNEMKASFKNGEGKSIARYFFGDGKPRDQNDDEEGDIRYIKQLVQYRANPQRNPVTFISCTNKDKDVEWMKDIEEVAPYCAELDDYNDELREVMKDQGHCLPFTRGFHLVCQLVAAICPEDLDAMDESVPFTKMALDNLLGIQHHEFDYFRYFDGFIAAQNLRIEEARREAEKRSYSDKKHKKKEVILTPENQVRANMNWLVLRQDFLNAPNANNIPAVVDFKRRLEAANNSH